ncbi:MAG: hypothetical protein U0Q47_06065 [Mycobacterium sp.]
MTELGDKSNDTTRTQILRAACREFAAKAYSSVSRHRRTTQAMKNWRREPDGAPG